MAMNVKQLITCSSVSVRGRRSLIYNERESVCVCVCVNNEYMVVVVVKFNPNPNPNFSFKPTNKYCVEMVGNDLGNPLFLSALIPLCSFSIFVNRAAAATSAVYPVLSE